MVYVLLADGFEEIEAISIVDVLRRANIEVTTVGIDDTQVRGTHQIYVKADCVLDNILINNIEGVILPGGMPGTKNLLNNIKVCDLLKNVYSDGILIGAICAAPSILGKLGFVDGKKVCCYPGFESEMQGAYVQDKSVCTDKNIITSKGPGTAISFALELVRYLRGDTIKHNIQEELQCNL